MSKLVKPLCIQELCIFVYNPKPKDLTWFTFFQIQSVENRGKVQILYTRQSYLIQIKTNLIKLNGHHKQQKNKEYKNNWCKVNEATFWTFLQNYSKNCYFSKCKTLCLFLYLPFHWLYNNADNNIANKYAMLRTIKLWNKSVIAKVIFFRLKIPHITCKKISSCGRTGADAINISGLLV